MALLNNKEIGERLKAQRLTTNKSMRRYAMDANVDQSQYAKIEKGDLPITDAIMEKLISSYDLDKDFILHGAELGTNVPRGTSRLKPNGYKKGEDYWLDKYIESLEKDKKRLFDSIHSNLIQVVAQAESLKFDVVSARRVLLDNVSLLRSLPEDALRSEADNIKKALIDEEIESGKKQRKHK